MNSFLNCASLSLTQPAAWAIRPVSCVLLPSYADSFTLLLLSTLLVLVSHSVIDISLTVMRE